MTLLPTIRSKKFVVSVFHDGKKHKVFQIIFQTGKKSGNTYLIVNFPYFSESKGILSKLTFPSNTQTIDKLPLAPTGKVTTHLVKYSHPLDGDSHFSADGKIYSTLRNKSRRLDVSHNHIFTLQIQGVNSFRLMDENKSFSENKTDIDFRFENTLPESVKFIGRWLKATDIKGRISPGEPKPVYVYKDIDETGLILSPPEKSPISEFVLLLSCKGMPLLDEKRKSVFLFFGGFNEEISDESKDATFLACIYPEEKFDILKKTIGCIDFTK